MCCGGLMKVFFLRAKKEFYTQKHIKFQKTIFFTKNGTNRSIKKSEKRTVGIFHLSFCLQTIFFYEKINKHIMISKPTLLAVMKIIIYSIITSYKMMGFESN